MTKKVAEELASVEQADVFEINPEVPYSAAELDWKDTQSRSTLEMKNPDCRPEAAASVKLQIGLRSLQEGKQTFHQLVKIASQI